MDIVFVDSCIIIDFIKGVLGDQVARIQVPCINFVVEMEIMRGARNKRELSRIKKDLKTYNLLEFNNDIAKLSTQLVGDFFLSHNLQIADSIIAATCLIYDLPLFTANLKDFRFIPGLQLYEPMGPKQETVE